MGNRTKGLIAKEANITTQSIIAVLEELISDDYITNNEFFLSDFQRLIDRLKDTTFKLAVVGEFSSGKSTFLNALIGKDLLKHGRKETTAAITEITNDYEAHDSVHIDVYFNDGTVKSDINVNDIMTVTATDSTTYSVANDIDRVSIRSRVLDSNARICFVDTPGLNGVADKHREKTIEQIKDSHACIYLMQVRGLGESDIEFVKYLCKYQRNIIFVQNFIDELKSLEGETPEQKIEAQRRIIEEKVLNGANDVNYSIVGISARKALFARCSEFNVYNGEELTEELRSRLYSESRFDDILDCINNLIQRNERDRIQERDTIEIAIVLLSQLQAVLKREEDRHHEEWDNSVDGRNARNTKIMLDTLKQNCSVYRQKLEDYIESDIAEIRKANNRDIENGIRSIENSLDELLSMIDTIEAFDKYASETVPKYLYKKICELEDSLNKRLNIKFENLICTAVSRIKQYTGNQVAETNIQEFEIHNNSTELQRFSEEESEISRLRKELIEKRKLDEKYRRESETKSREIQQIDLSINEAEAKISNSNRLMNQEINGLGAMPGMEKKQKPDTYYEYRGGLGILDKIFGPKKKKRWVTYYDDSAQQRWKKDKSDIETKYRETENQFMAQRRLLEDKKKQCSEDIRHIHSMGNAKQKEIRTMESLLETKIENLAVQKEKARQEYLRESKGAVLESVHRYLTEQIEEVLIDNFTNSILENKERVEKLIFSLFEMSFRERILSLTELISGVNEMRDDNQLAGFLSKVETTYTKLEEYICQL